jgi:hypothetical protein
MALAVRAERAKLVADLRSFDEGDWEASSLCTDWTVRDLVAQSQLRRSG